jgi:hypothetical protein
VPVPLLVPRSGFWQAFILVGKIFQTFRENK